VECVVVAPSPWFPFQAGCFGSYARFARVPPREQRHGIVVHHPRYPALPRIGMHLAPGLLYGATAGPIDALILRAGGFDAIDAIYFYPDGVAAALLGRRLKIPVSITGRGSDLSQIADFALPRRMIVWAARQAAALITVCQSLRDRLVELGIEPGRVRVLR